MTVIKFISLTAFLSLSFLSFLPQETLALKIRSRQTSTVTSTRTTSNRVVSSVRFKSGKTGVIINLSGLNNAQSVSYELTYTGNGTSQGAMGTISNITSSTDSRELLFGTCSGGVCRYHSNINNARLVITSKLKSSGFIIPKGDDITDLQGFPDHENGRIAAAQYLLIEQNLNDPIVRAEIIKNAKEAIENPDAWTKKGGIRDENNKWSKKYGALPNDDEIIKQALNHQKRNLML